MRRLYAGISFLAACEADADTKKEEKEDGHHLRKLLLDAGSEPGDWREPRKGCEEEVRPTAATCSSHAYDGTPPVSSVLIKLKSNPDIPLLAGRAASSHVQTVVFLCRSPLELSFSWSRV